MIDNSCPGLRTISIYNPSCWQPEPARPSLNSLILTQQEICYSTTSRLHTQVISLDTMAQPSNASSSASSSASKDSPSSTSLELNCFICTPSGQPASSSLKQDDGIRLCLLCQRGYCSAHKGEPDGICQTNHVSSWKTADLAGPRPVRVHREAAYRVERGA